MAITKIATVTVGSGGASSIDFTSIPGTFTDLMVVLSGRLSVGYTGENLGLRFNGATSGYSDRYLVGSGSGTPGSGSNAWSGSSIYAGQINATSSTANTFGNVSYYIPNYAGATNKSASIDFVYENNATTAQDGMVAGLWSSTSAITSVTLYAPGGAPFVQYSSATLYGVTKGSSGGVTVS